jgi:hypothetical protein
MRKWQIKGKKGALGVNIGVSRRGGNYYYEGSQGGLGPMDLKAKF